MSIMYVRCVSVQRHLYAKVDAHSRTQAVERARALG
jgi:ATP/maltotriose-dependent transcriptional regulator MalT